MTRDSVRRLCSPLTASNPRQIAISGTRKLRNATNDGSGSRDVVNSRRNRNGSSAVVSLIVSVASQTVTMAISTTSTTMTTTSTLVKWSASSLSITTPTPRRAEPSRRMLHSMLLLRSRIVEIAGVDGFEARFLDREPQQLAAGGDGSGGRFRAHIAIGDQA